MSIGVKELKQDSAVLKMETECGVTTIINEGRKFKFPSIVEALEYVYMCRFLALVQDKPVSTKLPNELHPVRSLLPPTQYKTVKVYVLEDEAV